MKKTLLAACCVAMAFATMTGCGSDDKKAAPANKNKTAASQSFMDPAGMGNIAYVDMDTLLTKYNLAVDYQEQLMAKQSAMSNEQQSQYKAIQNQQELMTRKMKNGEYKSEADMQGDQKTYENLQINAEKKLAALQEDLQKLMLTSNVTVQDSVMNFINEYNAKKKYTVILRKDATLFIDPALDITDEVVEGLNARYNKIK